MEFKTSLKINIKQGKGGTEIMLARAVESKCYPPQIKSHDGKIVDCKKGKHSAPLKGLSHQIDVCIFWPAWIAVD